MKTNSIGKTSSPKAVSNGDEWFINNLIGLAKAELQLVEAGKKTNINRHRLARWAFDNANKPLDKLGAI